MSTTELTTDLTDEQLRIAVAEKCGWRRDSRPTYTDGWVPPGRGQFKGDDGYYTAKPPDYLHSLDAMASARKVLTKDQQFKYVDHLENNAKSESYFDMFVNAPARAHALAFLACFEEKNNL